MLALVRRGVFATRAGKTFRTSSQVFEPPGARPFFDKTSSGVPSATMRPASRRNRREPRARASAGL